MKSIEQIKQNIWDVLDEEHDDLSGYQYIPGIHCDDFDRVADLIFQKLVQEGIIAVPLPEINTDESDVVST